jgi:large subunit ribosomal protein L21
MNFAVVEIAGKQFLARKGDVIETPKIPGAAGEKATFPSVLLYWDGKKILVGRPHLEGITVEGRILEFDRSPKVVVYKYKRRKDSHRKIGHRQDFARIKIEKITAAGQPAGDSEKAAGANKPAAAKKTAPREKTAATAKAGGKKKPPAGKKTAESKKTAARKKPSPSS